jgi:hypothetical protein
MDLSKYPRSTQTVSRGQRPLCARLPPYPCRSPSPISGRSALKTTARAWMSDIGWLVDVHQVTCAVICGGAAGSRFVAAH